MRRYLNSPLRMAENPNAASLLMRWIRAYHRLQSLLGRSQNAALNLAIDQSIRARDLGVERTSLSVEVSTRDAMIADLERQLADLHLEHNNTTNELAQVRNELEDTQMDLEHVNAILFVHDAQHLQAEGGQNADADAPESDMDTEDDMPPLEAPPSPMGSQATVNNLDDF